MSHSAVKTDKEAHASMIEAHSEVDAVHGNSHDNEHAEHVYINYKIDLGQHFM